MNIEIIKEKIKTISKKEIVIIIIIILIIFSSTYFVVEDINSSINQNYIEEDMFFEENNTTVVEIEEKRKIKVYITGEVNNPGVFEIDEGERVEDVILRANGTTEYANLNNVNLAYKVEDGQKIYIPNIQDTTEEIISTENGEDVIKSSSESSNGKININSANKEKLCEIPGVGEALAQRIIDYREQSGRFKNVEELKNVNGIGDKKFEGLKDYVIVN